MLFESTETIFESTETIFESTETIFESAETIFELAESIFKSTAVITTTTDQTFTIFFRSAKTTLIRRDMRGRVQKRVEIINQMLVDCIEKCQGPQKQSFQDAAELRRDCSEKTNFDWILDTSSNPLIG